MTKAAKSNSEVIKKQINTYCKKHLDNEYRELCNQVFLDLLEDYPDIFNRGKAEIWSAAIVWAIGSANFLGDKSFEPYATLTDVCDCFHANKSTVGQKAAKIKDLLDISFLNTDYRIKRLGRSFIDSLAMTPEGFIVAANMLEDDYSGEAESEEPEDDNLTGYRVVLGSSKNVDNASLYQLEYLVKKTISKESKVITIEKQTPNTVMINLFGTFADIEAVINKLQPSGFTIVNVSYSDSDTEE